VDRPDALVDVAQQLGAKRFGPGLLNELPGHHQVVHQDRSLFRPSCALSAEVCDSDDLLPASPAEPTRSLKPLLGKLAYLTFDFGVVCSVGSIGQKSRCMLVIAGREAIAGLHYDGLHIGLIHHV
jgi:hypothetical protein